MTAPKTTPPLVEAVAQAFVRSRNPGSRLERDRRSVWEALTDIERQEVIFGAQAAIATVLDEMAEPSEAVWGGLARAIIMAWDCGAKTPRDMFKHLDRVGTEIPDWLRNEPEMQALDHVPSKGTRAVIVHKAMLAAFRKERGI